MYHLAHLPPVAKAIDAADNAETLEELHHALLNYDAHPIAASNKAVKSQQSRFQNPIMLVTEKPEAEDLEANAPLSGSYGRVVRQAIEQLNVDINALHICYAVHWAPSDERSVNNTQIAASRPFLHREIELVRPRAIIAQGRGVVDALTNYRGQVTPLLGSTLAFRNGSENSSAAAIQALVTWHPAFVLRFPTTFWQFQEHLNDAFTRWGAADEQTVPGSYNPPIPEWSEPIFPNIASLRKKAA